MYGSDFQHRVQPLLTQEYQKIGSSVWKGMRDPADEREPTVVTVHSPFAKPVTLESEGVSHLVYDQYLGQIFNRFTKMYLIHPSRQAVQNYAFKLMSQRALLRGHFLEALSFGSVYSQDAHHWESAANLGAEGEALIFTRGTLVRLQETFVIAHELAHILHKSELQVESRSAATEAVQIDLERVVDSFQAATHNDLLSAHDRDYYRQRFAALVRASESTTNVEELVCDRMAFRALATLYDIPAAQSLLAIACLLALMNMRMLQYVDYEISARGHESAAHLYDLAILRSSVLRFGAIADTRSAAKSGLLEHLRLIDSFVDVYHEHVFDPFMSVPVRQQVKVLEALRMDDKDWYSVPRDAWLTHTGFKPAKVDISSPEIANLTEKYLNRHE